MQKILLAIGHRDLEDALTSSLGGYGNVVGVLSYREAILPQVIELEPDIVILRDTLAGTMDILSLIEQIRISSPFTRLIVMTTARPRRDPFLASLVSYGVYDILSSDKINQSAIVEQVKTPGSFADVASYYGGSSFLEHEENVPAVPEDNGEKETGPAFLKGFFKKKPHEVATSDPQTLKTPQINIEQLRETVREEVEHEFAKSAQKKLLEQLDQKQAEFDMRIQSLADKAQVDLDALKLQHQGELDAKNVAIQQLQKEGQALSGSPETSEAEKRVAGLQVELRLLQGKYDRLKEGEPVSTPQAPSTALLAENAALQSKIERLTKESQPSAEMVAENSRLSTENKQLKEQIRQTGVDAAGLTARIKEENSGLIIRNAELEKQLKMAEDSLQFSDREKEALHTQLSALVAEKASLESQMSAKDSDLNDLQLQLARAEQESKTLRSQIEVISSKASAEELALPVIEEIPDEEFYEGSPAGVHHTLLFMGAKAGIGNSTAALNTATALAARGHKTLYLEVNAKSPMTPSMFKFVGLTRGLDTALKGAQSSQVKEIDLSIVRPYGLTAQNRQLAKAYKKLPGILHFMYFTNEYLKAEKVSKNRPLNENAVKDLIYYLTMQSKYAYVVIDIQAGDYETANLFLDSGLLIDKLFLSTDQSSHSLTEAGQLIASLARTKSVKLIKQISLLLTKYNHSAPNAHKKVAKWLNVSMRQIFPIKDDRIGYLECADKALPYYLSGATCAADYDNIVESLI